MSELIDELKQEHKIITAVLVELQSVGMSSRKGMEKFIQSKAMLLSHLEKEDNKLYPILYQKAKSDSALQRTLDTFAAEMKEITASVISFYKKYEKFEDGISNNGDFILDISKFIVSLKSRIMKEEVAIYKSYEKLGID